MLRPIDSTITLAADVIRNTAATNVRQGDVQQAYNAVQSKTAAEREQRSVSELTKNQRPEIHSDNEGGQGQQYESSERKSKHKIHEINNPEDYSIPSDPFKRSTIDISI